VCLCACSPELRRIAFDKNFTSTCHMLTKGKKKSRNVWNYNIGIESKPHVKNKYEKMIIMLISSVNTWNSKKTKKTLFR
jgi:hypothetical protein